MEVLGLDVKREHVCQKHSEGGRNILGGIGAEIARRVEWCLAALSRVLHTHFDLSFRSQSSAIAMLDPEIDWTMLLENDLATLAMEITSRHRFDRRSVLPRVPRRDAGARYATSRMAPQKPTLLFCREDKPRSVAVSAINAVAACITGVAKVAQ